MTSFFIIMATNYQIGGWYNNPEAGGKNMRYWGPGNWTTDPNYDPSRVATTTQSTPQTSSGYSSGSDLSSLVTQQARMLREANQPAIDTLKSYIPQLETRTAQESARLEAKKQPLQQRYDALLSELTGREQTATAREFGKRGIPVSSGLAEQTVNERLLPITRQVTAEKEAGLQGIDELIAGLSTKEMDERQRVAEAIANLEAGAGSKAITQALSMYQQQKADEQAAAEQAWNKKVYEETTLPKSKADIYNIYKTAAATDPLSVIAAIKGMSVDELKRQFGLGTTTSTTTSATNNNKIEIKGNGLPPLDSFLLDIGGER